MKGSDALPLGRSMSFELFDDTACRATEADSGAAPVKGPDR